MNEEQIKAVKSLIREALRILEDVGEYTKAEKEQPKESGTENPQNTASGIFWTFRGDYVYFTVPFKYKDGFKELVSRLTGVDKPLKWVKDKKQWELPDKYASNDLFAELTIALFEENKEEHVP